MAARLLPTAYLAVPFFGPGGQDVLRAHQVITTNLTWTEHVSRIFYRRCASCHREGGEAPMALMTYDDVRPWAKAVKVQVLERRMPPWGAVKGYGAYIGDRSLSSEEIAVISSWVEGGAPRGDPVYLDTSSLSAKDDAPGPPAARPLEAAHRTVLDAPVTVLGVRAAANPPLEVRARTPDGAVKHLLWLEPFGARRNETFWLRDAVQLPAGAEIFVFPNEKSAVLLTAP